MRKYFPVLFNFCQAAWKINQNFCMLHGKMQANFFTKHVKFREPAWKHLKCNLKPAVM